MLNIFNSDAFSVARMTAAVNDISFVPGRIGELGLFEVDSVDVTTIAVEKRGDLLVLVPPTPRGGPGVTRDKTKRDLRSLTVPHFEINDAIYAEEVQNVRAFGSEGALETVIGKVARRLREHANSLSATEEYSRMGAVQGVVTYVDGTTLDLFTEFGVAQAAEINFDLATANNGELRKACTAVTRSIKTTLGGVSPKSVHAFCGDAFFDDLISNPEVRETFKGWSDARILREGYVGPNQSSNAMFEFGGIVWENYRGVVGTTSFINTDKCHIFPVGVPGLFKTAYAPADYEETVNTPGQRLYSRQYAMQNGKGRNLDVQMNALQYCVRPKVLMKGKRA